MDDRDGDQQPHVERDGTTEALVIRLWRPGSATGARAIRGHVSTLGGQRLGSFATLADLFAILEAALA